MLLLTPGPTPVPEDIRLAMAEPTIHHRTPEFENIFAQTRELLKELFGMNEVIILASSGTGAMEACVTTFCKKKALTINSGKFGERFGKIAQAHHLDFKELKYDWDTPVDVNDVISAIKEDDNIDSIFLQVCESAGGLRHPIEKLAKEVKAIRPEIMIIADGITAVGVEKIDTTNIDVLISGSQKALMLPPGLALIGLNTNAIDVVENTNVGYYFNLKTELTKQRNNTTAYTAATTLVIGLLAMLKKIKVKGFDDLYAQTKRTSRSTKEALKALGLTIYPKTPADSMSTVFHEEASEIRKILKNKYNVNIAGGQNHIKNTIFRINHMGIVEPYATAWTLNSIELALDELGIREFDGTGNKIFTQQYYK